MENMYYQMAVIVLAQRASILKFASDVTKISGDIEVFIGKQEETREEKQQKREDLEKITYEVKKLHSAYIRFINRLWYTEVTPQDQGIEMYNMALDSMGLNDQVRELQNEIKELYEFVSMSLDREQADLDRQSNEQMKILTILGSFFLPLMVVTGFFGMNLFFINDGCIDIGNYFMKMLNSAIPQLIDKPWFQLITYIPSIVIFILLYFCLHLLTRRYLKNVSIGNGVSEILKYLKIRYVFFQKNKVIFNKDRKNKNNSRKGE